MGIVEQVHEIVAPLLTSRSLELVDIEQSGSQVRITVDRPGGVDLDAIADATRAVSAALDEHDPIPSHYTLEVSSPGLERPLRTPTHFARAVGARVTLKTVPGSEGERRVTGVLVAADDDGVTMEVDDGGPDAAAERRVRYDQIERARTVFDWPSAPKPGRPASRSKPEKKKATRS
jgi:ribosome maturation factor RimP